MLMVLHKTINSNVPSINWMIPLKKIPLFCFLKKSFARTKQQNRLNMKTRMISTGNKTIAAKMGPRFRIVSEVSYPSDLNLMSIG